MQCDDIKYIFRNKFLTIIFSDSLELRNTKLFYDYYHLDLNFQKELSSQIYAQTKSHLKLVLLFHPKKTFTAKLGS